MELLGIFGPFQILIFLTVIFITAVLPILALIDILRSDFVGNNKIMWVLIVLFMNIIGSILYFLIGKNQKI